jgi:hypothetical protein
MFQKTFDTVIAYAKYREKHIGRRHANNGGGMRNTGFRSHFTIKMQKG